MSKFIVYKHSRNKKVKVITGPINYIIYLCAYGINVGYRIGTESGIDWTGDTFFYYSLSLLIDSLITGLRNTILDTRRLLGKLLHLE